MLTNRIFILVLISSILIVSANADSIVNFTQNNFVNAKKMKTIYGIKVKDIEGNEFDFSLLKGKKIMIVNTASECGYTPQYEILEALYEKYKDKNFIVVAFPCNDFGSQEPGNNQEISDFCKKNYGVSFPVMDKVKIYGNEQCEIYKWLTHKKLNGVEDNQVIWNFHKFLIDEKGCYYKMYPSKVKPDDIEIINWIEK